LALAKSCCLSPGGVFGSFAANKKQEQITEKPRNNNKKKAIIFLEKATIKKKLYLVKAFKNLQISFYKQF
jgi:hypothetical protein